MVVAGENAGKSVYSGAAVWSTERGLASSPFVRQRRTAGLRGIRRRPRLWVGRTCEHPSACISSALSSLDIAMPARDLAVAVVDQYDLDRIPATARPLTDHSIQPSDQSELFESLSGLHTISARPRLAVEVVRLTGSRPSGTRSVIRYEQSSIGSTQTARCVYRDPAINDRLHVQQWPIQTECWGDYLPLL